MSKLNLLQNWEAVDVDQLLNMLVGRHYGNNPQEQLANIIGVKKHEAQNIVNQLKLDKNDRVMDLGSGCGFIAESIAQITKSVACVDISQSFLDYASKVNAHHNNVTFHHVPYGQFNLGKTFTAIYAVSVFIHFNLYDCYWYLTKCFDVLEPGGRLLFDILNVEKLNIKDDLWSRHSNNYLSDRSNLFYSVYYNHKDTIKSLATQIGFLITHNYDENDHSFFILTKPN